MKICDTILSLCCVSVPPEPVMSSEAVQVCNDIVSNWSVPCNQPCPITGYSVDIDDVLMSEITNQTSYTLPIDESVCGETLGIRVSAINTTATNDDVISKNITIICTRKKN